MYTMMQVCKETGLTYQTLKYYCNEGLVPNVKRDKNNRRISQITTQVFFMTEIIVPGDDVIWGLCRD